MFTAVKHGLCTSVMIDKGRGTTTGLWCCTCQDDTALWSIGEGQQKYYFQLL